MPGLFDFYQAKFASKAINTVTTTYTATLNDDEIDCNSSTAFTLTLPPINSLQGTTYNIKEYYLKNIGSAIVTVQPGTNTSTNVADTIGGQNGLSSGYATIPLNPGAALVIGAQSSDTNWIIISPFPIIPSYMMAQLGSGAAMFSEEGNVNVQISSSGVSPGATGSDYVVALYSLPANSFDQANRGITISAQGSFATNTNAKRVKVIFNPTTTGVGGTVTGGTTVADTGSVTTSNAGWSVGASIFKYGVNGSNTQLGLHTQSQMGSSVASLLTPSAITAVESGNINIAVTGNATTNTTDVIFNFLEINGMN